MMKVVAFYGESNIRQKRRSDLLGKVSSYFYDNGINQVTMSDIATYLKLERRTLYSYYNNIKDLIVDAQLYSTEIQVNAFDEAIHDFLREQDEDPIRIRLYKYFKFISDGMSRTVKNSPLIMDFDAFFRTVDRSSSTYERFIQVNSQLNINKNYLERLIEEGHINGEIKSLGMTPEEMALVLDQSARAYLTKTMLRMGESSRYRMDFVDKHLKIIVEGVCV